MSSSTSAASDVPSRSARPRIGIAVGTGKVDTSRAQAYARAVAEAGGDPVWLEPATILTLGIEETVDRISALLLPGGKDIHPHHYGQPLVEGIGVEFEAQRDAAELPLARATLAADLPVLGICRGIQVLNVVAGGTLHQNLALIGIDPQTHQKKGTDVTHPIHLQPSSQLAARLGATQLIVNSAHHQAVHLPAPPFVVTAYAADGVIEAIEAPNATFAVGVQWHPERMLDHDKRQLELFRALVEATRRKRT